MVGQVVQYIELLELTLRLPDAVQITLIYKLWLSTAQGRLC